MEEWDLLKVRKGGLTGGRDGRRWRGNYKRSGRGN